MATVNLQVRVKKWLRDKFDQLFDSSRFHAKGDLMEDMMKVYASSSEPNYLGQNIDSSESRILLSEKEKEIAELKKTNEEQKTKVENLEAKVDEHEKTIDENENQIADLEYKLSKKEMEYINLKSSKEILAEDSVEVDKLKKEKKEMEEEANYWVEECLDYKKKYADILDKFNYKLDELEDEPIRLNGQDHNITNAEEFIEFIINNINFKQIQ